MCGAFDDFPLGIEGQALDRFADLDPLRFVYFVVVVFDIAGLVTKETEIYEFVIAHSTAALFCDVPVLDFIDSIDDLGIDAGFFADFANGSRFGRFTLVDKSFWQLPAILSSD